MLAELSRRERDANIKLDPDLDIFMKVASTSGQEEVSSQIILSRYYGSEQRKHVTMGEMIVGPLKVLLMDKISTGLDTSTTFKL
nr:hypothetical protein [Tanacetum cinerariifolium]